MGRLKSPYDPSLEKRKTTHAAATFFQVPSPFSLFTLEQVPQNESNREGGVSLVGDLLDDAARLMHTMQGRCVGDIC